MKKILDILKSESGVDGYRINETATASYELFFVHEKLETVRATDTVDTKVTVYADHDGCRGDSSFAVYKSMSDEVIRERIRSAVERAGLVFNEPYELVAPGELDEKLETNFEDYDPKELGRLIADAVFTADKAEGCTVNALEVFIYRERKSVVNSRGVCKCETVWRAMVEAIPTHTDDGGSVELYESMRFTVFDEEKIKSEIADKMREVHDRAAAAKPEVPMTIDVVLRPNEILDLMWELTDGLSYSSVYMKANVWNVGDEIQKECAGDLVTVTMKGAVPGSDRNSFFDEAGTTLRDVAVIEDGVVKSFFGADRFGQYLGVERPSGELGCIALDGGTMKREELAGAKYLECASLSGLQVDVYSDYLGGEIRLAYLCDGDERRPVTGITFSARLKDVLASLRMTDDKVTYGPYEGPSRLLLKNAEVL
ncbi:MAG: hypothetical protein IJQ80_08365 [Clostridia bacterium]|nr:hypothetical protein [Clostridia bacterium]